jgi:hypothetical protein
MITIIKTIIIIKGGGTGGRDKHSKRAAAAAQVGPGPSPLTDAVPGLDGCLGAPVGGAGPGRHRADHRGHLPQRDPGARGKVGLQLQLVVVQHHLAQRLYAVVHVHELARLQTVVDAQNALLGEAAVDPVGDHVRLEVPVLEPERVPKAHRAAHAERAHPQLAQALYRAVGVGLELKVRAREDERDALVLQVGEHRVVDLNVVLDDHALHLGATALDKLAASDLAGKKVYELNIGVFELVERARHAEVDVRAVLHLNGKEAMLVEPLQK